MGGHEGGDLLVVVGGDLIGSLGELGHQLLAHPGDLVAGPRRVATAPGLPSDAEGCGEEVGEDTVVKLGGGWWWP
jgi:hypothetical protein